MKEIIITLLVLVFWNLIVFFIYGLDKRKAQKNKQRISEKALIILAFVMGGIGAQFGRVYFAHKTKGAKFKLVIPLAIFCNLVVLYFAYVYNPF